MELKTCTKCGEEKLRILEYFGRDTQKKDGFRPICKKCTNMYDKQKKDGTFISSRIVLPKASEGMKFCSKCMSEFPESAEYFDKSNGRKGGLQTHCKICRSKHGKVYYQEKREEVLKRTAINQKLFRENNKELAKERDRKNRLSRLDRIKYTQKQYRKLNREKLLKIDSDYRKKRRKVDPLFRLLLNLKSRTRTYLHGKTKSDSMRNLIGCSSEQLRKHIESQFKTGMTWENYGPVWHLDHIKPFAAFDNIADPAQQREVCHYTNLQPLFAEENLSKGAKWEEERSG